ncbi:uncharacterized protein LOC134855461 isoform X2 [Symsagittifera roscoffensis]|uniref:uncharacterized protein LOC134855461 isoform X2 n=1 Tax=Symsagittifera roscoffensis TaxID=84072 RepID=UPI00307B1227
MLIKFRRKSIFILLFLSIFFYLSVILQKRVDRTTTDETSKGSYVRDGKGFVQCKEVDHNCYKNSQISLGIVGEFASKSVVLCSDGHHIGEVSIPNLSTLLHVIEVPSANLLTHSSNADKEEQSLNLKTFIKSYGADNLFRLSEFFEEVEETSYLVVLAYTGIEIPATELSNEVDRIFLSQTFSKLKPGNLFFGLFDKSTETLVYETSTTILDKLQRTFCLKNNTYYSHTHKSRSPTDKLDKRSGVLAEEGAKNVAKWSGKECKVEASQNQVEKVITCDESSVPVHLYSTSNGDTFPSYCVDGNKIEYKGGSKKISRGLHLIVFTSQWKFKSYEVYDTYDKKADAENLYKALMSLESKNIVMLATHDEASNKLSDNVKGILFRFGSAAVARMKYRDSWVFIGQKGLKGKSVFEQLVPKKVSEDYPSPSAAIQSCVPKVIPVKAWIDTLNDNLALFCENQVMGYEEVCERNITFPPEAKSSFAPDNWDAFMDTSPLLVIPDLALYESHVSLFRTLESVAKQPHLRPEIVFVALCKNDFILEFTEIVEMFGFNVLIFDYRKTQCFEVPYRDAFIRVFENKQVKQAVIIGAEVQVEPDFLHFIFETSPLLYSLNTDVISITAFNPNSFVGTNFPGNSLIRMEEYPFYGWVLTRELYDSLTKTKEIFKSCCSGRNWYEGWVKPKSDGVIVAPGVSRVALNRVPDAFDLSTIKHKLFVNNRQSSSLLTNPFSISFPLEGVATIEAYKSHLSFLFANCDSFNVKSQSSLDNFINKWNSTISPNRVKSSVVEDGLVRAKKCATVKLNALKEQGKNGMVMKNLFTFLQFGHTEPFGSYEGAIVTYKESIPVLIYENNSKLAASISVV